MRYHADFPLLSATGLACGALNKIASCLARLQLAPIIKILVEQCAPRQLRFNKLTAITWLQEIIKLGQERLQDLYGLLLNAVLQLVADSEHEIRDYATETNEDLLHLVRKTPEPLDFSVLLHKLRKELQNKDPIVRFVPTHPG